MSMPILVAAFSKHGFILFTCPFFIPQLMRCVKMFSSGNINCFQFYNFVTKIQTFKKQNCLLERKKRFEQSVEDNLIRSEEHTSELQSRPHLVCRLLLEKKKKK